MKEFKKKILEVKIFGEVHELRFPSVKTAIEFEKQFKDESINAVLNLLENCGLPKNVSEELDLEQLRELVDTLVAVKKKD